jgi:ABC-type bacteriocin/lantibiotic exporter with double-glycine peptidase domain
LRVRRSGPRRRLLAPEMPQASALDCGPAALASMLAGFGIEVAFDRLRDACRTGRDGTSIDALEAVANETGLDAEQVLVPVDHVGLPAAGCVPCILLVKSAGGAAHFVTVWSVHGRRAQVMDPAAGRRWPRMESLEREAWRHRALVPAAAWRSWAGSEEALETLGGRLAGLGVAAADRRSLIGSAAGDPRWLPLAALDAAARFTRVLTAAGALRRGAEAGRILQALWARGAESAAVAAGGVPPAGCWTVRAAAPEADGVERVFCEGAVLVRVRARRLGRVAGATGSMSAASATGAMIATGATGGTGAASMMSATGRTAGGEVGGEAPVVTDRVGARTGGRIARRWLGGRRPAGAAGRGPGRQRGSGGSAPGESEAWTSVTVAVAGGALGRLAEAALMVAALELLPGSSRSLRLGILAAALVVEAALLGFEAVAASGAQWLGRRRETGLRLGLARKIPRLPDRYLRTRLMADLAERAHRIGELRRGPEMAVATAGAACDAALGIFAMALLDPVLVAGALATGAAAIGVPLLALPRCEERSRRARALGATLGALYLDVLRGRAAVRAHGAAAALRRRHEELLAAWLRARREAAAAGVWLEAGTVGLLHLAAAALVLAHVRHRGLDAGALVVALWAFQVVGAGQRLAVLAGSALPLHRSLRRRVEETLGAGEECGEIERAGRGGRGEEEPARSGRGKPAGTLVVAPREAGAEGGEAPRPEAWRGPGAGSRRGQAGSEVEEGAGSAAATHGTAPRAVPPAFRSRARGLAIRWERCRVESDGNTLLAGLELTIPAGQHVALLGRSGAGKSTLIGTLLGWQRPAGGRLWVDGRELDAAVATEVRRAAAWLAPEVTVWRRSLLANLRDPGGAAAGDDPSAVAGSGDPEAGTPAAEALRTARLLELVPRLDGGLQEPLGEGGCRLSGGEAQRVRFARALRRAGVRLALLDEPFRGLGRDQRGELLRAALSHWRWATLLCVTHSPREAGAFDRVLILERGRQEEDGTPEALAARRGSRYRAMLEAEARSDAALRGPGWRRLVLDGGRLTESAGTGAREGDRDRGRPVTVAGARAAGAMAAGGTVPGATVAGVTVAGATVPGATMAGATVLGAMMVGATAGDATVSGGLVDVELAARSECAGIGHG